jgi:hypothetical protein
MLFSSWHQSRCDVGPTSTSTQGAGKDLAGPWEVENASVIIFDGTFEGPPVLFRSSTITVTVALC